MIPPEYQGREQTFIKHIFLTRYLEILAYKVLLSRSDILNYVDAFAGPWGNSDNDSLTDTSFDLALRTLDEVKARLNELGRHRKIRFCFCEKNKESYKKLKNYTDEHQEYDIKIFPGKFEENLENINRWCRNEYTFSFIDPTGWSIDSESIFKFLRNQNGEFLINFMAEDINRFATFSHVSKSVGLFLANPEWEPEFEQLPKDLNTEQRILALLKKKIKESGAAKYTPDIPIQKPRENRVKMRLLLGSNNPMGLEVFRDVQSPVERLEIMTRTNVLNKGKNTLFDNTDELTDIDHRSEGIGSEKYLKEAQNRIEQHLVQNGPSGFRDMSIIILEYVSIRQTQLNDLVKQMKRQGIVTFDLPPNKRIPQNNTVISITKGKNTLF